MGRRPLKWIALTLLAGVTVTVLPVLALRWLPPPTSAFMLRAAFDARQAHERGYHTEYEWVELERISANAALAVIASEDQQFPFHAGFDVKSIREAVRTNARGHRVRGASTISQQVAKNLFLWPGRTYVRKGLEAYFTVLIELLWPKERILEVYLNVAEFGRGIYGVEAASRHFFHHPAARLTQPESALLAAVLPNPHLMHVERPSAYVASRVEWIVEQMRGLGGAAYLDEMGTDARGDFSHARR